jgi:hypothetical protein
MLCIGDMGVNVLKKHQRINGGVSHATPKGLLA